MVGSVAASFVVLCDTTPELSRLDDVEGTLLLNSSGVLDTVTKSVDVDKKLCSFSADAEERSVSVGVTTAESEGTGDVREVYVDFSDTLVSLRKNSSRRGNIGNLPFVSRVFDVFASAGQTRISKSQPCVLYLTHPVDSATPHYSRQPMMQCSRQVNLLLTNPSHAHTRTISETKRLRGECKAKQHSECS